jgi:Zn-dependent protease with chaperone function
MDAQRETADSDIRKYLDLRLNDLKLRTVDGLSVGVGRILSLMLVIMLGAIVLAAFAFGTLLLLGDLIGSWAWAAFIIGGFFLIILGVILLFWRKMFVNTFVRLFIGIFYENE